VANLPLTIPDLVCTDDLDLFIGETTSDLQTLDQDVLHIVIETLGSNIDDVNRGVGLPRLLSGTEDQLAAATAHVDAQLQKDDRIDASQTTLTKLPPGSTLPDGTPLPKGGYSVDIQIVAAGAVLGVGFTFNADGVLVTR